MKIRFADLWRPSGTIGRGAYALIGVLGFALKHNLDRLIATYGFHRPWSLFNYWIPVNDVTRITALSRDDVKFLAAMVALALPFIWVGVVLTLKRLRSARLPASLVILFFVPFVNLLFFVLLSLWPERDIGQSELDTSKTRFLAQIVPESRLGSAALAVLVTALLGLAVVLLGSQLLMNYGWGVFVAAPFVMGFVAPIVYGVRRQRTMRECMSVAYVSLAITGVLLLLLAFEGVICLLMAAALAVPLAAMGAGFGYLVQRQRWYHSGTPAMLSCLILFAPGLQWLEHVAARTPTVFEVRSVIDIQAPPEKVWKQVIAFTEIPPPTEWFFRMGIAYPMRAEIIGSGPGAERHCVFSTGAFIEPIEIWDEPHRLKFSVASNPAPMQEWTPYSHIEPAHLHGFLVSSAGEFLLTPLPNGGTRLQGTTWYRHSLWPEAYWRLWSDTIIHRIHMRVLRHIRDESERP